MEVKLIDYQPNALDLLIYSKNTRLMGEQTLESIAEKSLDWKLDHLDYMFNTIQSSFEFVRYVFEITDVSRSFTHQLVRTRNAAYAQQSQRTVDVRDEAVYNPSGDARFDEHVRDSKRIYAEMVDDGIPVQDAREILPTGINTSILMATHLREIGHMAEVRLCTRTAGQYQQVFKAMKEAIVEVHPFFEPYIQVHCVKHGTCCFPNYTECPIQEYTVMISTNVKRDIKAAREAIDHVANPIAKDGKTM